MIQEYDKINKPYSDIMGMKLLIALMIIVVLAVILIYTNINKPTSTKIIKSEEEVTKTQTEVSVSIDEISSLIKDIKEDLE